MNIRLILSRLLGFVWIFLMIFVPLIVLKTTNDIIYYCVFLTFGVFLIGMYLKGSETNIFYQLYGGCFKINYEISGYVEPGFENVKKEFEKSYKDGMSECS